ncbi:MAG: hypothetical protein PHS37_08255 [Candidatus Omnitrophica bacterium]|nr:hypothetical protein [Candidatus Omnitrophota bacterium]
MRKIILAVIAVMASASFAFAAVSSPCGAYKKPAAPSQPRVDTGNRRDVLDFRVPTQTADSAQIYREKATQDRETLISGQQ